MKYTEIELQPDDPVFDEPWTIWMWPGIFPPEDDGGDDGPRVKHAGAKEELAEAFEEHRNSA